MKMGLDQAVLQGIENNGGKDIMTKEEVEKLLKHGAYDIFKEDKDGTSEKESNDFVSQDIDSILARRAKTVIHDNTGSNSNAAGGTFSKASFKSTSSDGVAAAEIDVDDPDFWTKVVGEAKKEEDEQLGKRIRNKVTVRGIIINVSTLQLNMVLMDRMTKTTHPSQANFLRTPWKEMTMAPS